MHTYIRVLGRFAPIFYFNCEHFLFMYIVKQKQTNKFYKNNRVFSKFSEIKICYSLIFENLSSINLPWGHARTHKKIGPDQFSRFSVYWIQTNRQAKYRYIDNDKKILT